MRLILLVAAALAIAAPALPVQTPGQLRSQPGETISIPSHRYELLDPDSGLYEVRDLDAEQVVDPASFRRLGGAHFLFEQQLPPGGSAVVLPPRYEILNCNLPCQILPDSRDGRLTLIYWNPDGHPNSLRLEAAPLRGSWAASMDPFIHRRKSDNPFQSVRKGGAVTLGEGWIPISASAPVTVSTRSNRRVRLKSGGTSREGVETVQRVVPEAYSLTGQPLLPDEVLSPRQREREADVLAAWRHWRTNPTDAYLSMQLARRMAWYGRFQDADALYTTTLQHHPDDFRLLRHRGHRRITLRNFAGAADDLLRAAQLAEQALNNNEPDLPDDDTVAQYVWSSWYHLGLAEYFAGDFADAERAFRATLSHSATDDKRNAASYWLINALRRLNKKEEIPALLEPVHANMQVEDNISYYELLQIFKGLKTVEETIDVTNTAAPRYSTVVYGIANWSDQEGRKDEARILYERIIAASSWMAFGQIGSEAALVQMGGEGKQ